MFSPERVGQLEEEEFRAFLESKNNKHWSGLHRQANRICADMNQLRRALSALVDESRPLAQRFDEGVGSVPGMGKAIASAILLVTYPRNYGVWNNTSEAALKELGVWPEFEHGMSLGQRYARLNSLLVRPASELETDLWTLDALFWVLVSGPEEEPELTTEALGALETR